MANLNPHVWLTLFFLFLLVLESGAKVSEVNADAGPAIPVTIPDVKASEIKAKAPEIRTKAPDIKVHKKNTDGAALLFADELKQTLERYLFGICPQSFKIQLGRNKNNTFSCDLDTEQQDLAGRFATLALRAHTAARSDCIRFGGAVANTLGELARTAASRNAINIAATNEANKKRKLSKSQKMKIQAKQRTALAVKKKAAAVAAAAAAKMASS